MNRLLSLIIKNFWYKVAALIMALIIWGIVQGEEVLEINRRMNVVIVTPPGTLIKGPTIRKKDITIRGPRVLIGEFSQLPIEARVRIPKGTVGNIRIRIDKEFIRNWDNRVNLTVHDAYINIFADEKVEKEVSVREVLRGAPAEGFFVEKVEINPSRVTVSGLKSELKKLKEVTTEPLDITGFQQSKSIEAGLTLEGFSKAEFSVDAVKVSLQIGDSKVNKRFENIPVEVVGSDYNSEARPSRVTIEIQGTPGVLKFVQPDDLRAFVDVAGLPPGRYEKEIQVKIPPETVLIETIPEKSVVKIFPQKKVN